MDVSDASSRTLCRLMSLPKTDEPDCWHEFERRLAVGQIRFAARPAKQRRDLSGFVALGNARRRGAFGLHGDQGRHERSDALARRQAGRKRHSRQLRLARRD